jgi:MerR family copper efflux transcriptional regulator
VEQFTIGQLAQQTGVSRKAIRLYEEKGLILPSIKRSEGNYRVYSNGVASGKCRFTTLRKLQY